MNKKYIILGVTLGVTVLGFLILKDAYNSIYRLSRAEVSGYVSQEVIQCDSLEECILLPGDILIRRYVNSNTRTFDTWLNPYFTHVALYLGGGQIVEAVGKQKNRQDEIQIVDMAKSDWFDEGIESWVLVRPRDFNEQFDIILSNLKSIAENPEYGFGLGNSTDTQYSCADLIFSQLVKYGIVVPVEEGRIITPDYLFLTTVNQNEEFEVFGYRQ